MAPHLHNFQIRDSNKGVKMNAIDLLKKDHQGVEQLFSEFMSVDNEDFARREDLFQQIDKALLVHSDAEEEIFYPSVEKHAPDIVKHALSEHQEIRELLAEMLDLEIDAEEFENRMTTLMQKVQTHVQEEEGSGGVLEIAQQNLTARDLDDIGRRIEQLKKDSEEELAA
jgi:hemerythrin superfamily protein